MKQEELKATTIDRILGFAKAHRDWGKTGFFSYDEINHILAENYVEDDFNAFKAPITNQTEFREAVIAATEARNNPEAPWLMMNCSCGGYITLTHNELLWRRRLGLGLPYMCSKCNEKYRILASN